MARDPKLRAEARGDTPTDDWIAERRVRSALSDATPSPRRRHARRARKTHTHFDRCKIGRPRVTPRETPLTFRTTSPPSPRVTRAETASKMSSMAEKQTEDLASQCVRLLFFFCRLPRASGTSTSGSPMKNK